MVVDEITDGRRIAQLLSSELTGLSRGALADVAVVDADTDVVPTPEGSVAYAIEYDGERIGSVAVAPDAAVVDLELAVRPDRLTGRDGVAIREGDPSRIVVERGAAVKSAVDALRAALDPP